MPIETVRQKNGLTVKNQCVKRDILETTQAWMHSTVNCSHVIEVWNGCKLFKCEMFVYK